MSRTRNQAHIALPKIEIDEPRQLRLSLKGRLCQDLEAYRAAYKEAHGNDVELEAMIPHILEIYISSDRRFRSWRNGRRSVPAE